MESPAKSHRSVTVAVAAALVAITVMVYWPVQRFDFVRYDDPHYVTRNFQVVKGLTADGFSWALRSGVAGNWHPLTWISHMLDCQWHGLNPAGHHVTSLVWHCLNVLLLFAFFVSATGTLWRSALVAALFAVHPLHVESVAWISERKDVLSLFFALLALLAYLRYVRAGAGKRARWYCATLGLFACGLMSKPMLVTMPCLLLLLDYWPLARLRWPLGPSAVVRGIVLEKVPFLALSAAISIVTLVMQGDIGAMTSLDTLPLDVRVGNALLAYVRYAGNLFWPVGLAVLYPTPPRWPFSWVIGAAVVLVAITTLCWRQRFSRPWLGVGWLWYVGTLVPVIGLVQVGEQCMADRYTYMPLTGLAVMLAWALAEIVGRWPGSRWAVTGLVMVAVVGLCVGARLQLRHWQNNITLFTRALAVTRDNAVAHNNLGISLLDAGDVGGAEAQFSAAVLLRPNYGEALMNQANCLQKHGAYVDALGLMERSLQLRDTAVGHYNYANLLGLLGRNPEAESHYLTALQKEPDMPDALQNLGSLRVKMGRLVEAERDFLAALRLRPNDPDLHQTLGALYAKQGNLDAAVAQFELASQLPAARADAEFNLAGVLFNAGRFRDSASHYSAAVALRPDDREARLGAGRAFLLDGKPVEAVQQFEILLRVVPDASTHHFLALALDSQGKAGEALEHYRAAARLAPREPLYLNDLAWLLATNPDATLRQASESVQLAEIACQLTRRESAPFLGTLAAAYAEAGRFAEAATTAEQAIKLATDKGLSEVAATNTKLLEKYRARKPYRSGSPP